MSAMAKIEARSTPVPEAGCWLWLGALKPNGYPIVYHDGRHQYAHRLALSETAGKLAEGAFVCHRCDTRSCVNPAHLFASDHTGNMRDMVAKGRHWRAEQAACANGHPLPKREPGSRQRVCRQCANEANRRWRAKA